MDVLTRPTSPTPTGVPVMGPSRTWTRRPAEHFCRTCFCTFAECDRHLYKSKKKKKTGNICGSGENGDPSCPLTHAVDKEKKDVFVFSSLSFYVFDLVPPQNPLLQDWLCKFLYCCWILLWNRGEMYAFWTLFTKRIWKVCSVIIFVFSSLLGLHLYQLCPFIIAK